MKKEKLNNMLYIFGELLSVKGRLFYDVGYYGVLYGIPSIILIFLLYQFGEYLASIPAIPWYIFAPAGIIFNILVSNIILAGGISYFSKDSDTALNFVHENPDFFKRLELGIMVISIYWCLVFSLP